MINIKEIGCYISEPFHWVDWHASIKFEKYNYYIINFCNEKCFFDSVSDIENIDLDKLQQKDNFGLYTIHDNIIEIRYNPGSKFELMRVFTILSSDILLDENLKEYHYIDPVRM